MKHCALVQIYDKESTFYNSELYKAVVTSQRAQRRGFLTAAHFVRLFVCFVPNCKNSLPKDIPSRLHFDSVKQTYW